VDQVHVRLTIDPRYHVALVRAFALDRRPPRHRLLRFYHLTAAPRAAPASRDVEIVGRRETGDITVLSVQVRALRPSLIPVATRFRGDPGDRVHVFAEWDGDHRIVVASLSRRHRRALPDRRGRTSATALLPARLQEFLRLLTGLDLTGFRVTVRELAELSWPVEISGLSARIRRLLTSSAIDADIYEVRLWAALDDAPFVLRAVQAHLAIFGGEPR
jgi:hypothetical protein